MQVNFNWQSLSLYFILTRFKCKTVFFALLSPVSSGGLIDNAIDKIRNLFFSTDLVGKFQDLFAGLCKKAGLIKEYDLVFAAGQRAGDAFRKRTRVVDINYHDFDHFTLSQHSDERVVLGDYCVFLDEGSIANEDIKIANSQSLDPEKFYGALNQFFDDVEKKFGLKVVIAAHPGIDYDRKVFGGREVYTGKTCVLVKYSKVVISLASMSVSFAALYKKPIIFICTHEYMIKSQSSFRRIKFVSNILGLSVINIDSKESINALEIPGVDPDLYDNYKYLCLVSKESEGKRTRDIVVKTLKEL